MASGPTRPPQLTDWHLDGEAPVYVRQSTEEQKRKNVGSGEVQKAQAAHLAALGFPDDRIRVIDDRGQSGQFTTNRSGFQELMDGIEAGRVRVVAMSEVSRLGRDDIQLAEFLLLCEAHKVLLLENGIPRDLHEVSDWGLLKMQALFSEMENRRKNQRSRSARLATSRKGIATWRLPAGFDRGPDGAAVQSADPVERGVIQRVWREALEGRTAKRIAQGLRADGLKLPAHTTRENVQWTDPNEAAVYRILKNPLYAGLLILWKTRVERTRQGHRIRRTTAAERESIAGRVERYVSPEDFDRVHAVMAARKSPGMFPLKRGMALCAGLVQCGRHHCNMPVHYTASSRTCPDGRSHHYYTCPGPYQERERGHTCMAVSGLVLDREIERIVLSAVRCPSPTALRRAIHEENVRRDFQGHLLAAEVRRTHAEVAAARARVEESRARGKNPHVTALYEDELEGLLRQAAAAARRATAAPAPTLLDASPTLLGQMAAVFREFPRLWRSGTLGPDARKAVVRGVVARIEIPERSDPFRAKVTLHSGQVLECVVYTRLARRRIIEALDAEGFNPEEIAAEMQRRGILNTCGEPFSRQAVRDLLWRNKRPRYADRPRGSRALHELFCALWTERLFQVEIAARLNAAGFRTGGKALWTDKSVLRVAKQLGLPPRWQLDREALRAPLTELVEAGWDDAAIAEDFNARGLRTHSRTPWVASNLRNVRLALGIHRRRRSGQQRTEASTPTGASA